MNIEFVANSKTEIFNTDLSVQKLNEILNETLDKSIKDYGYTKLSENNREEKTNE